MQKHVNLVDLVKSFPTNIFLQNLASIQKRTSPIKFAHLAEKSGEGSISNLSTKVPAAPAAGGKRLFAAPAAAAPKAAGGKRLFAAWGLAEGAGVLAERSERFGGNAAEAFREEMQRKRDGPECLAALEELEAKNTTEVSAADEV